MDFRQYGGFKGNSICHYLIEFVNFILHEQESGSTAVLACLVDFSKAFNRQDHAILITKLCDLGVPGWLLKLVVSFLENRKMFVRYNGEQSRMFSLPGGGPQGSLLGLFLFLVLIDGAGFDDQKNDVGNKITKKKVAELNEIHMKYIDDLSLLESVNMNNLDQLPQTARTQPEPFRCRTGHQLVNSNSRIYSELQNIQSYAEDNKMKLNLEKTKLMLFNPCKNKDFLPDFKIENTQIELVEQCKLLGVVITSNLSWSENTSYITKKCYKRMCDSEL